MTHAWLALALLTAPPVQGVVPENNDDAYRLAEAYTKALAGQGDQAAREYHLGGMTFMAQTVAYDSAKIISRDPTRKDDGKIEEVHKYITEIDKAGRKALDKMASGAGGGDESTGEITAEKAAKLMAPANALMKKFQKQYPTFHYVARAEKSVYWHPKNPVRPLLERAPKSGPFHLEVHRFMVETTDGPMKTKKQFAIKILRLTSGDFDTGWKILPAADWNPDE